MGMLGSSVNFTWSFSADVEWVDWGLKESGVKDIKTEGTLVALRPTGPVRFFPAVPPAYAGRVSGICSSPGEAIFTLSSITKNDENVYGCKIRSGSTFETEFDYARLLVLGEYELELHIVAALKNERRLIRFFSQ